MTVTLWSNSNWTEVLPRFYSMAGKVRDSLLGFTLPSFQSGKDMSTRISTGRLLLKISLGTRTEP